MTRDRGFGGLAQAFTAARAELAERLARANEMLADMDRIGLSASQAARLMGVQPATVTRWLTGERRIPEAARRKLKAEVEKVAEHVALVGDSAPVAPTPDDCLKGRCGCTTGGDCRFTGVCARCDAITWVDGKWMGDNRWHRKHYDLCPDCGAPGARRD